MRRVLPMCLVLLLGASVAFAQVGRVGVFGDPAGASCVFTEVAAPAMTQVYLVHIEATETTGSQFSAPKPACLNATYLFDNNVFQVVLGNTQTGIAIGYGECKSGTFHICTMNFMSAGTSPDCCIYYVLPDPTLPSEEYEFVDCQFNVVPGGGKAGVVTQTAACDCVTIPNEQSSWGKIKSLYSE